MLVGSIGLVAAVPISTWFAALVATQPPHSPNRRIGGRVAKAATTTRAARRRPACTTRRARLLGLTFDQLAVVAGARIASAAMDFNEQYGPWALIAGASEGLGAAFADECASRGCNVVLVARRQQLMEETAAGIRERHGVETRTLVADLGRPDIGELVASVTDDIDVGFFVYNAAFAPQGLFVNVPLEEQMQNIAVNCTTPTILSHMLGKKMVDRGRGGLVLVSSGAAHGGMKIFTTYAAAKAYELILGEGLWDEFRDHGVDALGYVVGATATPTFSASTEADTVKATNRAPRSRSRRRCSNSSARAHAPTPTPAPTNRPWPAPAAPTPRSSPPPAP